jgi:hypothetical protein
MQSDMLDMYNCSSQYREAGGAKELELIGTAVNAACQENLSAFLGIVSPGISYSFMKMDGLVATLLN